MGGSPFSDIYHGSTTTSSTNGTYFGIVDEGSSVTRTFIVANIGSCPLTISNPISSSNSDFSISSPYTLPIDVDSYYYIYFNVTFTAPIAGTGTQRATISILNNDNTTFNFDVTAEMFNFSIPGPGGVTADFRLWLKSTRGVAQSDSKVVTWNDLGTNGKHAIQPVSINRPLFVDNLNSNINFNPVIKFDNSADEQFLYNDTNGFYSQDIFVVVIPDNTVTSSSARNTIFSGVSSSDPGDITGLGFGNYSSRFTNETLSYNQNTEASFNGVAVINTSFSNAGVINVRNNSNTPTGQEILYNSNLLTVSEINDVAYSNVGSIDNATIPPTVLGTKYWIGRNFDLSGSFNGRIAEVLTFAERLTDDNRHKVESYLAIKYGITLGDGSIAQKDYINSFNTKIWDITLNNGFNYNVAGIGRDDDSDLNQKQSKSRNDANEITIGLGGLYTENSKNPNEFLENGDFLMWGNNNADFNLNASTNIVTIATGNESSLNRINRIWKIVETKEDLVLGDVKTVFVGIPETAFSTIPKTDNEEYVLIVSDDSSFNNSNIIDVIPLKINVDSSCNPILDCNGSKVYETWYDFDGTKFISFGKASRNSNSSAVNIESGDYLVGEYDLNLNVDSFTVSAWIKSSPSAATRTIISKGEKLQLRLNSQNKVEVISDDLATPRFVSNMQINDSKWHQISFVYASGSMLLYIDGILDHSIQNIPHPSPNYNHFAIGATFEDKNTITNHFLGEIDEVYVWDIGLSEEQVRYIMNQEIEKFTDSGTDFVKGKQLPRNNSNNEFLPVNWSNLRAYYDFNSFFGSTVEGLTNCRHFLRVKYFSKDKNIATNQTAPLPYISKADGNWEDANSWENSTHQITPNSIGLDGTTKIGWNIVQTNHNLTINSEVGLVGLINEGNKISVSDAHGVQISHYLLLNGVIDLVGESQLIQTEGSVLDELSTGYIERDQQGVGNRYRYNDWASPVYSGNDVGGNYATLNAVLKDGTDPNNPQPVSFTSNVNGSVLPLTISSYWIYKYANKSGNYSEWQHVGSTGKIYSGEGYLMKGVGDIGSPEQNYVFTGKPNNGTIELTVAKNYDYLVGNPYPSAIDADQFIIDNANSITGTLYFWEHYGGDTHNLSGYQAGYATYSLSGGTIAAAHVSGSGIGSGTKTPQKYIGVGQGFFVVGDTIDGGTIQFKNSQRAFQVEDTINSVFFKGIQSKENNLLSDDGRTKFRIGLDAPAIDHRQLLLTIDKWATNRIDFGYDAIIYEVLNDDMYWIIEDKNFVIQATNHLEFDKEFPIGLVTKKGGLVKIGVDLLENVDPSIEIYIKDKTTNLYHKINSKVFEIYLPPGNYNDRFAVVFNPVFTDTLSEDEFSILTNSVHIFSQDSNLRVVTNQDIRINEVSLINLLGQKVYSESVSKNATNSYNIDYGKLKPGIYFVNIQTEIGNSTKKIIIQ